MSKQQSGHFNMISILWPCNPDSFVYVCIRGRVKVVSANCEKLQMVNNKGRREVQPNVRSINLKKERKHILVLHCFVHLVS